MTKYRKNEQAYKQYREDTATVRVDRGIGDDLKAFAEALGCTQSAAAAALLREGMARLPDDESRWKWYREIDKGRKRGRPPKQAEGVHQ